MLLDKHWPSHPSAYLVSEGYGIYNLTRPKELVVINGNATDRIINALKKINTEYILFSLDDYYLSKNVNDNKLKKILEFMVDNNFEYCGFNRNKHGKVLKTSLGYLSKLRLEHTYDINLFLCIWKKESFLQCLKSGEDIWKAEVRLTKRFKDNNFNGCFVKKNDVIPFVDVVQKGSYIRRNFKFFKKNNLYISDRKVQTIFEVLKLQSKYYLSKLTPSFLRDKFKSIYRKKGGIVYSDYAENGEED